ncbi:MAG: thioredoxin domain-containing protein, partial [Candidatus Eisenbacteria bacterium]|nr:thioredoxin domain-containing protein [Candidatus Eisenbacteria bacterium]
RNSSAASDVYKRQGTAEGGALYETRAGAPDLIARPRRGEDEATPSGNGVAAYGLIRLARILGEPEAERPAEAILRAFAGTMEAAPIATAQLLLALDLHLSAPREIAIVGPRAATATEALRAVVDRAFLPHAVLLQGEGDREAPPLEGLRDKPMHGGKPAAYVCTSFTCRAPVTTPEELAAALRE